LMDLFSAPNCAQAVAILPSFPFPWTFIVVVKRLVYQKELKLIPTCPPAVEKCYFTRILYTLMDFFQSFQSSACRSILHLNVQLH
jgi:hypothetical protein